MKFLSVLKYFQNFVKNSTLDNIFFCFYSHNSFSRSMWWNSNCRLNFFCIFEYFEYIIRGVKIPPRPINPRGDQKLCPPSIYIYMKISEEGRGNYRGLHENSIMALSRVTGFIYHAPAERLIFYIVEDFFRARLMRAGRKSRVSRGYRENSRFVHALTSNCLNNCHANFSRFPRSPVNFFTIASGNFRDATGDNKYVHFPVRLAESLRERGS